MCKFHILGMCTKGATCHFAHDKEEMSSLPDLYRTKLCKTLLNTGSCDAPDCRYAHSKDELRTVEGFNSKGEQAGPGECDAAGSSRPVPSDPHRGQAPAQGSKQPKATQRTPAAQVPAPAQSQPSADVGQAATIQQIMSSMGLYTQAAMLQMGQAAQAHVVEAMRLQAMAANMHGGNGVGLVGSYAAPGYPAPGIPMSLAGVNVGTTGLAVGIGAMGGLNPPGGTVVPAEPATLQANAPSSHGLQQSVTTLPMAEASSAGPRGGFHRRSPSGTALYALAEAEGPHAAQLPVIGVDPMPDEPIQIEPLSLRSLSSHSLVQMGEEAEAASSASGGGSLGGAPMTEAQTNAALRGLKGSFSAAARLNTLGEGNHSMPPATNPSQGGQLDLYGPRGNLDLVPENETIGQRGQSTLLQAAGSAAEAGSLTEKRFQDTPFRAGSGSRSASDSSLAAHSVFTPTPGSSEDLAAMAETSASPSDQPEARHPLLVTTSGITVKNTFLEFQEPTRGLPGLRSVQTAGGRLDLLCQE